MQMKLSLVAAALTAALTLPSQAAPVSNEGTLAFGAPVTGLVSGTGWGNEMASQVDFWRFSGTAGQSVDIRGTRLDTNLDPALSLYFGTTTADNAQFINDADWGGLTYLDFADDETPNAGPGGDPLLAQFLLPFDGAYTIAFGGFQSNTDGPFSYSLQVTAVPAPESALLLIAGLSSLLLWNIRRGGSRHS